MTSIQPSSEKQHMRGKEYSLEIVQENKVPHLHTRTSPEAPTQLSRRTSLNAHTWSIGTGRQLYAVKITAPPASLIFFSANLEKNLAFTTIG